MDACDLPTDQQTATGKHQTPGRASPTKPDPSRAESRIAIAVAAATLVTAGAAVWQSWLTRQSVELTGQTVAVLVDQTRPFLVPTLREVAPREFEIVARNRGSMPARVVYAEYGAGFGAPLGQRSFDVLSDKTMRVANPQDIFRVARSKIDAPMQGKLDAREAVGLFGACLVYESQTSRGFRRWIAWGLWVVEGTDHGIREFARNEADSPYLESACSLETYLVPQFLNALPGAATLVPYFAPSKPFTLAPFPDSDLVAEGTLGLTAIKRADGKYCVRHGESDSWFVFEPDQVQDFLVLGSRGDFRVGAKEGQWYAFGDIRDKHGVVLARVGGTRLKFNQGGLDLNYDSGAVEIVDKDQSVVFQAKSGVDDCLHLTLQFYVDFKGAWRQVTMRGRPGEPALLLIAPVGKPWAAPVDPIFQYPSSQFGGRRRVRDGVP